MKIEKALVKEKRYRKVSFIVLVFLLICLPILAYLANANTFFILIFLAIIEFLIILQIVRNFNFYYLKFKFSNNRFRFKCGMFASESLILCDRVALVHTNKAYENLEIIVVTDLRFKNKKLRPISKGLLQRYPELEREYLKLKKKNPQEIYYFQVIRRGALNKYILLDNIYKNCVHSIYTASAIENIKIARGQNEI